MKYFSAPALGVALAASIFVLSGCATAAPPSVAQSSAPPPVATPMPTPDAVPVVTPPPATQIPQSCEDLFPASSITESFGVATTLESSGEGTAIGNAIEVQEGTIACSWRGDSDRELSGAAFVRRSGEIRAADSNYGGQTETGVRGGLGVESSIVRCSDHGRIDCSFSATVGDYYVYGFLGGETGLSQKQAIAAMAKIFEPGLRSLEAEKSPPVWRAPVGSWPLTVDCSGVDSRGKVAEALQLTDVRVTTNVGFEDYTPTPEVAALGGTTQCTWSGVAPEGDPISHFEAILVAGGAWYWDAPPADADAEGTVTILTVPGADDAALRCSDDWCFADARVGNNALKLTVNPYGTNADVTPEQWTELLAVIVAGLPEPE